MRLFPLAATALLAVFATTMAHAQAATPENHPGFPLAEAIAASGCVLHQDDVGTLLDGAGLTNDQFPQMAVPLMQTGFLRSTGNGTLTLVNWGACVGLPEVDADADVEADASSEGDVTPETGDEAPMQTD